MKAILFLGLIGFVSSGLVSCKKDEATAVSESAPAEEVKEEATTAKASPEDKVHDEKVEKKKKGFTKKAIRRGKAVYMSACISCHHPNPAKDGSLGPAVAGSSEELLRLRVLELKYPEGYTPKRKTGTMTAFPHLKKDIRTLYAYLNSKKVMKALKKEEEKKKK